MESVARRRVRGSLVVVALVCLLIPTSICQDKTEIHTKEFHDPTLAPGKPVVLIFVRTDCPISNRYAPTIQSLANTHAGRVTFWLVYPSKSDTEQVIAAQMAEYGYKLPWTRDPDRALVSKAKATITPEAALFDASGRLRYHGRIDDLYVSFGSARQKATSHDLDDAVKAVLAGKPVSQDATEAVGCYISDLD